MTATAFLSGEGRQTLPLTFNLFPTQRVDFKHQKTTVSTGLLLPRDGTSHRRGVLAALTYTRVDAATGSLPPIKSCWCLVVQAFG